VESGVYRLPPSFREERRLDRLEDRSDDPRLRDVVARLFERERFEVARLRDRDRVDVARLRERVRGWEARLRDGVDRFARLRD